MNIDNMKSNPTVIINGEKINIIPYNLESKYKKKPSKYCDECQNFSLLETDNDKYPVCVSRSIPVKLKRVNNDNYRCYKTNECLRYK